MTLSPTLAVHLADAAYAVKDAPGGVTADAVLDAIFDANPAAARAIEENWSLGEVPDIAHGRSGLGVITSRTGFAMVLRGKPGRPFAGEQAVAIRGTAGLYDALTDLDARVSVTPVGLPVHAGFAGVYRDLHLPLKQAVGDRGRVHIVGHSLGGALGNLLAADLSRSGQHSVNLYTFGAPRAGLVSFAAAMGGRRGLEAVYRVHDVVDPIPMLPVFPFLHAPTGGADYRVGRSGGLMRPDAHRLIANYLVQVRERDWPGIANPPEPIYNYRQIDELIEAAGIHVRIPGGTWGLWALGKVLQPLMEIASLVLGGVRYLGETVLDAVAKLLVRAAEVSRRLGAHLLRFMEMVMRWAGMAAVRGVEMTERFLRYLLRLMMTPILVAARKAVDLIG